MNRTKVKRVKTPDLLSMRKKTIRVTITVHKEQNFSVKTETKLNDIELEVILEKRR